MSDPNNDPFYEFANIVSSLFSSNKDVSTFELIGTTELNPEEDVLLQGDLVLSVKYAN